MGNETSRGAGEGEAVDLDAMEALLKKATPGPWKVTTDMGTIDIESRHADTPLVAEVFDEDGYGKADADLIVALVNSAPALLARLRDARREALEEAAKFLDEHRPNYMKGRDAEEFYARLDWDRPSSDVADKVLGVVAAQLRALATAARGETKA